MDTTADYKALYLKKFFQWQDICHQQSIRIENLRRKFPPLKGTSKKTWDCCYRNQCAYVDGAVAQQALKEMAQ